MLNTHVDEKLKLMKIGFTEVCQLVRKSCKVGVGGGIGKSLSAIDDTLA